MKPIEIQDLQNTIDKIIEKDKKNEKPAYDSNAISKFSNANLSLDKPVLIKNKIRLRLYIQKTSYLLRRHTQRVESQLWLCEMNQLNLAQLF